MDNLGQKQLRTQLQPCFDHQNDENMLVIRNNTRVADIYLTEFMRLFNHFRVRNRFDLALGYKHGTTKRGLTPKRARKARRLFLAPNDSRTRRFYKDEVANPQRLYFAGKASRD